MSTIRLYAAPLMLVIWAALTDAIGNSKIVVVVRLLTMAAAIALSIREAVRVNGERKHRHGR